MGDKIMVEEILSGEQYSEFIRKRITELRIRKNVSEYQMSYDLGKSKGYIQSISSGATLPSMDAFIDICNYFNITPVEFFDFENNNLEKIREILSLLKLITEEDLDLILEILKRLKK